MKIAVVGAGLTGAVIAERYAANGHHVFVYEKRNHIAGNCYDYIDGNGILVSKYGPHFFHTNNEEVWKYVNKYAQWIPYEARVKTRVRLDDGSEKIVPVPVNITTVNELFGLDIRSTEEMDVWLKGHQIPCENPNNSEEVALSRVGKQLFELIFKGYTLKQWEKEPKELAPSVLARIPVRNNWDDRYYTDKYQALPEGGYTAWISKMFDHQNIEVCLNTDFLQLEQELKSTYDKVYFTGPIDQYFANSGLEKLEYRSLRFEHMTVETPGYHQPYFCVNEASADVPYTRTCEYKHLPNPVTDGSANASTVVREFSISNGDPYYPIPNERNLKLYEQYQSLALQETTNSNVYFVGRLASYKYFNMDQAIEVALKMVHDVEGYGFD